MVAHWSGGAVPEMLERAGAIRRGPMGCLRNLVCMRRAAIA